MENLFISESIKTNLLAASKWLNFLTVLGAIATVIVAVAGICFLFIPMRGMGVASVAIGIVYIMLALIYIYPIKKSFSVIRNTRNALYNSEQESLETAAINIHELLRFFGILSIVVLVLYALIAIFAVIASPIYA